MYAAIRRYQIDPAKSPKVIQDITKELMPLIQEEEGFLAYYILDVGDGAFATVSIFEDQAGVEASRRKAAQWIQRYISREIFSKERITSFQVKIEETVQGHLHGEASRYLCDRDSKGAEQLSREEISSSPVNQDSELLSIDEVRRELKMGRSWVYSRIRNGEIPSLKLGHNIKVRREDLDRYLEGQRYRTQDEEKEE
jgi:excisionase family DNA binding protein